MILYGWYSDSFTLLSHACAWIIALLAQIKSVGEEETVIFIRFHFCSCNDEGKSTFNVSVTSKNMLMWAAFTFIISPLFWLHEKQQNYVSFKVNVHSAYPTKKKKYGIFFWGGKWYWVLMTNVTPYFNPPPFIDCDRSVPITRAHKTQNFAPV